MDQDRFDSLTISFATARSRRSLFKIAGSLVGGALAAGFGMASAATPRGPGQICRKASDCDSLLCGPPDRTGRRRCLCPVDSEDCDGTCLDPTVAYQHDALNCGACGHRCASGQACCNGTCVPSATVCNGVCCAEDQVCAKSGCCTPEDPTAVCAETSCGTIVFDNCGQQIGCPPCCAASGDECQANADCCSETCVDGTCASGPVVNGQPCDDNADCLSETCCNHVCVDPASFSSDSDNCGACGNICSGQTTDCAQPICSSGTCSTSFTPSGTPRSTQTLGDCHKDVCDGAGGTTTVIDDTDVPADTGSDCMVPVCIDGVSSLDPVAVGTPCDVNGGTLCDGFGACLECLIDSDCASDYCLSNTTCCVPDSTETTCDGQCGTVSNNCFQDIDCGLCCEPDSDVDTCEGRCGLVLNNCDDEVDCGECCAPEEIDVTCSDICGWTTNNCDEAVDCGECCVPESTEEACAGLCGPVMNNCDEEIDCGECCVSGYEKGSDGETCVPTQATCDATLDSGLVLNAPNLQECNFAGYELNYKYIISANLVGANLAGALLVGANLSSSNLSHANLTGASLWNAVLSGVDFSDASLSGVNWTGATCPDGLLSANNGGTCCNNLNGAVPASC